MDDESGQQSNCIEKAKNSLETLIENNCRTIRLNVEFLLTIIQKNANTTIYNRLVKEKEKNLHSKIERNTISDLKSGLLKQMRKHFPKNSSKFNSIFASIDNSLEQVDNYLRQIEQLSQTSVDDFSTSSNGYSNNSIKEVFIDNMQKGITSKLVDNFEERKKLANLSKKVELLDLSTQEKLKYVSKSLLYYQEYKIQIENPQDLAKIEKRMFKSSLDLIFVMNSMTCPTEVKDNKDSKDSKDSKT